MKKTLLLAAFVLTVAINPAASTLSPEQALRRAGSHAAGLTLSRSSVTAKPVMTIGTETSPAIYIFNKSEGGYLIVGADDVSAPVLGYSDSGAIDPSDMPENLRWWLGEYENEIKCAIADGARAYSSSSRADYPSIDPMLTSQWNQSTPYNQQCPTLNGTLTVTGCVATAFAQVLYYHKWPQQLSENANFSYNWNSGNKTLTWDAAGLSLDWDNMLDTYTTGYYSAKQASAVATLMKACGYSVKMDYNTSAKGGSGAVSAYITSALLDYFGYDKGAMTCMRLYYDAKGWQDLIYNNLQDCGPVIISGSNSGGGHCFVCDGYQSDGYFHINWGWSGMSDGYFLLSALDPDSQGIGGSSAGYNAYQDAIVNIRKPADNKLIYNFIADGSLSATISDNQLNMQISGGVWNYTPATVSGAFYAKITGPSGSTASSLIGNFNSLGYLYGYNSDLILSIDINKFNFPLDGTYKVSLAVKPNSTAEFFDVHFTADQLGYVEVTRNGSVYSVNVPSAGSFSITDIKTETPMFVGSTDFLVSATGYWSGSNAVTQEIYGVLLDASGSMVDVGDAVSVDFNANGEPTPIEYLSYWSSGVSAGQYRFIFACYDGDNLKAISSPISVTLSAAPSAPVISVSTWLVKDADAVDPTNITIQATVRCTSGYFFDTLMAAFFDSLSLTNLGQFNSQRFALSAGESTTITFSGSIGYIPEGTNLISALFYGSQRLTQSSYPVTVGSISAIDQVYTDESGENAEYYNLQGIRVDNPAHGFFIRRQNGKTDKIYIP